MSETTKTVSKTVTIVGYVTLDGDERSVAQQIDESRDYMAKETNQTRKVFLRGPGGYENRIWDGDVEERLRQSELGDMRVETNVTTSTDYSKPTNFASRAFFNGSIVPIIETATPDWWSYNPAGMKVEHDDGYKVKVYCRLDTMPLLKHQSEMNDEDIYEDEDEDFVALKYKIRMDEMPPELIEEANLNTVQSVIHGLKGCGFVGKIRFLECEQTEKGVCYNV